MGTVVRVRGRLTVLGGYCVYGFGLGFRGLGFRGLGFGICWLLAFPDMHSRDGLGLEGLNGCREGRSHRGRESEGVSSAARWHLEPLISELHTVC